MVVATTSPDDDDAEDLPGYDILDVVGCSCLDGVCHWTNLLPICARELGEQETLGELP
jgi:hypothetical protein